MYQNRDVTVIIAAAGSGKRMGGGISKQYRRIGDMPVLIQAILAFSSHPFVDAICVTVKEEELDFCEGLLVSYGLEKRCSLAAGGKERQDSVYRGLCCLLKQGMAEDALVLVHDGARPFVSAQVITRTIEALSGADAVCTAVPVKDTVKQCEQGVFTKTLSRASLCNVQTPQGFKASLLLEAFKKAFSENFYGTDDAVLVERMGEKVYLVEGDYKNIKITTEDDMEQAERLFLNKQQGLAAGKLPGLRIGTGYDVHVLVPSGKLILGGVELPFEKGLLAHSDGDVLVHGVMDALLSAASLGDIGQHFPDSDPAYAGISSLLLLSQVGKSLFLSGFRVVNIDATVICQEPKIAPYTAQMRENIGKALGISTAQIGIKGTTTEGLGSLGRGEGIAAQAVVLLDSL